MIQYSVQFSTIEFSTNSQFITLSTFQHNQYNSVQYNTLHNSVTQPIWINYHFCYFQIFMQTAAMKVYSTHATIRHWISFSYGLVKILVTSTIYQNRIWPLKYWQEDASKGTLGFHFIHTIVTVKIIIEQTIVYQVEMVKRKLQKQQKCYMVKFHFISNKSFKFQTIKFTL